MREELLKLKEEALVRIADAKDLKALNEIRVMYLGKKGPITEVLRGMGSLPAEERPVIGQMANDVREELATALEGRINLLEQAALEHKLKSETIDITLPG